MDNHNIAEATVKKISEILKIPAPEVFTDKPDFFPHNEVSCMYIQSKDIIVFNEIWIKEVDTMEVVAAAIHETRHAYQYYCVKNNVN